MLRVYCLSILVSLIFYTALTPHAYGTTLSWNPNTEQDLAGYTLYCGTSSGNYSQIVDVGNVTSYSFEKSFMYENIPYFVALTAYDTSGNDSSFSIELSLSLDDFVDHTDNCPEVYNPDQKDVYPPDGNGIGNACDCEGDFACDGDVDGIDGSLFRDELGRSFFTRPCTNEDPCNGDFDCDGDVDGSDNTLFKADAGRNIFNKPCPVCSPGEWCNYQ